MGNARPVARIAARRFVAGKMGVSTLDEDQKAALENKLRNAVNNMRTGMTNGRRCDHVKWYFHLADLRAKAGWTGTFKADDKEVLDHLLEARCQP